jgi:ketosteroid isomerase-like protein
LDQNVVIFESGNVESSLAEYESHHMKSDIAFMAAMNIELLTREVIDAGESATVISRSRISGKYKNKEIDLVNTETLVIQRRNGKWKVVHVHWSSN